MQILTIDFETYYDSKFSLSKLTTEEYIRSPLFEVIGVGVKVNDSDPQWFSGTHAEIKKFLQSFDIPNSVIIAHNAMFDAAILSWIFNIIPHGIIDTLSMARAIDGIEVGGSLKAAAERYGLGIKGTEVVTAIGKRRGDFHPQDLKQYGEYCKNDCNLTYDLFGVYSPRISPIELKIIDTTIRMFSEPALVLDAELLGQHLDSVKERKAALLSACLADKDTLMSNPKFAELLSSLGVVPPTKTSTATGKETWAFAKTDEGMIALLDHEDDRVQTIVAARLGTKSTLEETRTERFIGVAGRGTLPVPLRYYAAKTGRWGGSDKINLQNLPSRGNNTLKNAIKAPDGYVIIDSDSSQIEARVLAWLSGQTDLVEAFHKNNQEKWGNVPEERQKYDVYKIMASKIYRKPIGDITKSERFVGKTVILGSGYGMGGSKFQLSLKASNVDLELEECNGIISTYRDTYPCIPAFWRQGNTALECFLEGVTMDIGAVPEALSIGFDPVKLQTGFKLPNGFILTYPELRKEDDNFTYKTRSGRTKIYGGKIVENICQAIARCVIAEQLVQIAERYKVVLTVHDAIASLVPEDEAEKAQKYIEKCMRTAPKWATGLPLNCESGIGRSYGEC